MVVPIEMQFGEHTCMVIRNDIWDEGTYGHYLSNTIEQQKMAVMQAVVIITVATCYYVQCGPKNGELITRWLIGKRLVMSKVSEFSLERKYIGEFKYSLLSWH